MGAGCSNLALLSNPCELQSCVSGVTMLQRDSVSPSVQWIVDLHSDTHYNGEPVSQVFIKLFVNPFQLSIPRFQASLKRYIISRYDNPPSKLTARLDYFMSSLYYELVLYNSVIAPIVSQHICPFFSRVYTAGYECSYQDLLGMLPGVKDRSALSAAVLGTLTLNLGEDTRYVSKPGDVESTKFIEDLKYCMMISEVMQGQSLHSWIYKTGLYSGRQISEEFWTIIFQVAYACYVMELAGVVHNDLHPGNIFVTTHPAEVQYCIQVSLVNPVFYQFKSRNQVKVFDFDRANFGQYDNPVMTKTSTFLEGHSYSTKVIQTKDFLKLFINLAHSALHQYKNKVALLDPLLLLLTADARTKLEITAMFQGSGHMQTGKLQSLPLGFYKKLFPLSKIMTGLAKLARIKQSNNEPRLKPNEHFFAVDASFFTNSHVKTNKVHTTLRDLQLNSLSEELRNLEQEESEKREEMEAEQQVLRERTVSVQQLELELGVQRYDLSQLQTHEGGVLLQMVNLLQK